MKANAGLITFFALIISTGVLISCTDGMYSSPERPFKNVDNLLAKADTLNAIRSLESHILKGRNDARVYAKLGVLYRSLGTIRGRLKSQHILEKGLEIFPDSVNLLMELGKTYYKQTFYPDADRCFKRIIKIDSSMCEAIYFLGLDHLRRWLRNRSYKDELQEAGSMLEKACRCNNGQSDWLLNLAFVYYAMDKYSESLETSRILSKLKPSTAEPHFLMGAIYLKRQLLETAWKEFQSAIKLTPYKQHYLDISTLLDDQQRKKYVNSSNSKREEIRRIFWKNNDPDPTTEINERFMQHISRVVLADFFFSFPRGKTKGSKTDRGIALIKFGWPSAIDFELGSGLEGRSEIWIYTHPITLVFTFKDEFLNDNFEIPLYEGTMKYDLLNSPHFGSPNGNFIELPGALSCYAFKDNTFLSSAYVVLTLDADAIRSIIASKGTLPLSLRASIFDPSWNQSQALHDTMTISMQHEYKGRFLHIIGPIKLPFSSYHLALTVENEDMLIRSTYERSLSTLQFMSDSLTLSDIVLSAAEDQTAGKPFLVRAPFRLFPLGKPASLNTRMLSVYFEIYNLGVHGLLSNYSISYQIYKVKKPPRSFWRKLLGDLAKITGVQTEPAPTISQTYKRSGLSHKEKEKILIDLSSASPGDYILSVRVFDGISQQLSQRFTHFRLNE